jgi:hypothetical protein
LRLVPRRLCDRELVLLRDVFFFAIGLRSYHQVQRAARGNRKATHIKRPYARRQS